MWDCELKILQHPVRSFYLPEWCVMLKLRAKLITQFESAWKDVQRKWCQKLYTFLLEVTFAPGTWTTSHSFYLSYERTVKLLWKLIYLVYLQKEKLWNLKLKQIYFGVETTTHYNFGSLCASTNIYTKSFWLETLVPRLPPLKYMNFEVTVMYQNRDTTKAAYFKCTHTYLKGVEAIAFFAFLHWGQGYYLECQNFPWNKIPGQKISRQNVPG